MHYSVHGAPQGIPLVYLHGGPGDAVTPSFQDQFDLTLYRLFLYDQRGCGKSKPRNHLEKNTTRHLLKDLETLRRHVGVDQWVVAGGSWGSALALLYAEKWPRRVLGLLLRGVFDLSLDNSVLESMYPENKALVDELVPSRTTHDFYKKTMKILTGKKTTTRRNLIHALNNNAPMYVMRKASKDSFAVQETLALIGQHYEGHHFFVPSDAIYRGLHRIRHVPTIMVEGRYDMVTPMNMAYTLSKRLPQSELRIVPAGHTMHERAILKELVQASKDLAKRV
jgi:proline iminopeptidase